MALKWEDSTSYSRGKERIPTTWTCKVGRFELCITCGHIYYPGKWVMHFSDIVREHRLKAKDKEAAQVEAVLVATYIIKLAMDDLTGGG